MLKLSYSSLKKLCRKWVKKAKIEKRITSYGFRRSRYTHLATKIAIPALYNYMEQVQGFKVIERLIMKKLFLHDNETNIN
jgi:integrase